MTGHSNLPAEAEEVLAAAIAEALAELPTPLAGVTCLARGADQVFARVVLDRGGSVEVILPAADYRRRKVKPDNRETFEALLGRAAVVDVLPLAVSNRAAYLQASEALLDRVDHLIAVWDGEPPDGRGGTADAVAAARSRGLPVTVVWPTGVRRI